MSDKELVIKIPEHLYKLILAFPSDNNESSIENVLTKAVESGTILPKGHGKLFDEKELKKEAIRCEWSRIMYDTLDHTLSYMKPIIEADAEDS